MKILLVDDAPDMRLVMKRTLQLMGYQITVAEDGEQAWHYLQTTVFHVVITDWEMPNMDGTELCRRIRAGQFPNYVYIILLTGRSGKHNLITGMEAGADDFATKPVEQDEMSVLLRAAERVIRLERKLEQKNQHLAAANHALQQARDETLRDLCNAATLQMGILPTQKQIGPLHYAWFFRPAKMVGGDTFNYFPLTENLQFFYTVDVSGHGISPALLSMYLSNLLTSTADQNHQQWRDGDEKTIKQTLLEMLNFFNTHLVNLSDHYFTMILGVIDTNARQLYLIQAGHPKPFMVDRASGRAQEMDCTGFPVGLLANVEYEVTTHPFTPESRLVLFSDGMFEMLDKQGKNITEDELGKVLQTSVVATAIETVAAVCEYFSIDNNRLNQPDDVSMLMIDFEKATAA
jgi:sigma-B regulation protein RsbU (phosphoserine phosphatase)